MSMQAARLGQQAFLKEHLVPPAIAEVVLVQKAEPFAVLGHDLADLRDGGIDALEIPETVVEHFRVTEALTVDLELVEMRVRPAHCRLDVLVQLVERAVLDLNPPPDRRL